MCVLRRLNDNTKIKLKDFKKFKDKWEACIVLRMARGYACAKIEYVSVRIFRKI